MTSPLMYMGHAIESLETMSHDNINQLITNAASDIEHWWRTNASGPLQEAEPNSVWSPSYNAMIDISEWAELALEVLQRKTPHNQ